MSTTAMRQRAEQFLAAAASELEAGRLEVAFALARTAAELAGKALLLARTGSYPTRDHAIGRHLEEAGVIPPGIDKRQLAHLLTQYTRGEYGFAEPVHRREAERAVRMARALLNAVP